MQVCKASLKKNSNVLFYLDYQNWKRPIYKMLNFWKEYVIILFVHVLKEFNYVFKILIQL